MRKVLLENDIFQGLVVFVICVYSGNKQPRDVDKFPDPIIAQTRYTQQQQWVRFGNTSFDFLEIKPVICDRHAWVFVKSKKSDSECSSCDNCMQQGVYHKQKLCFLQSLMRC